MPSIEKKIMAVLPEGIASPLRKFRKNQILQQWVKAGRPIPPPHQVKQLAIENYALRFGCKILVETGTYLGDMMQAQKGNFEKLYSIELSKELWESAVNRFRKDPNVEIINGDSGKVLFSLAPTFQQPVLFWLDGHYSGGITAKGETDCPVFLELDAILTPGAPKHVILIDDARLFNGTNDYPTILQLEDWLKSKNLNYQLEVTHDLIRIAPKN
jgi:hypothetical protein